MRKINILLLSLTVLSLMNVNYYKNNDNKQLEETTNDTNLIEARKLNDSTSNEEVKISNILKIQYTDEEDGTKSLRFVAGISTLSLDAYFVREEIKTNDNKINMPKKEIQVTSAYTGIQNGNKVSKPSEIFGEEYNYVVAYTLKNIPEEYWFTEINVSLVVNEEISTYRKANVTGAINNYSGILVFSDDHQAVGLDNAVKDTIETVNIPAYYYNITNDEHNLIANENDKIQVLEVGRKIDEKNGLNFSYSSIKNVNIPYGISIIGYKAFQDCKSLNNVVLPESVTYIDDYSFGWCQSLDNIKLSTNITYIGHSAFCYCRITKLSLEKVNKIDDYAFYSCEWLEEITLSSCLEYIGHKSFGDCKKISDILLPNTLKFIGSEAFYSCSKLKKIIIPSSVIEVKENVFSWCGSIEIYCRFENKPDGWSDNWIGISTTPTIVWNYKD